MISKTPQFDLALDKILEELVPHMRACLWAGKHKYCEGDFEITKEDIEFLNLLRAPAPKYCPTCRRMRRYVHMNQTRFFKRPCNAPGHSEQMISILPPECPFPVYDYKYYLSDSFDPFQFGRKYDPSHSPLEQLFALRKATPMPSFLNRDLASINSDYSNGGRDSKNCYYTFEVFESEDVWYSGLAAKSREIMDSVAVMKCDTAYDVVQSEHVFKSISVYFSKDCTDSILLNDCRNCQDCFGCVNLRNKKYCIWNEQKTKEEYEMFIKENTPLSYAKMLEFKKRFDELVHSLPLNASRNVSVSNVSGTIIRNGRNLFDVSDSDKSEHVRHSDGVLSHKDSMDVLFSGGNSELLYQTTNVGSQSSRVLFSVSSKFATDCEFVFNSKNLSHCFMCIGMQDKSYCILNTQYEPEEYWKLVDEIKTDMLARGEYGEFADLKFSAQSYNSSMAGIYFPLSSEIIESCGGFVSVESEIDMHGLNAISAKDLPDTIQEVDNSILQKAILCEKTGRPFRIIQSELNFLRKMGLPIPRINPIVRSENRYKLIPVAVKYQTKCEKCKKEIQSIYNPNEGFRLYCESCFQQEVV